MPTRAFFTICARNYLAYAFALGESLRAQHPEATLFVWLLDPGEQPAPPAGVVLRSIGEVVPADGLPALALHYDLLELATAVKPLCFARHFEQGLAHVVYLDPDILVFRPLEEVFAALGRGASGVLTPHVLEPLPHDGAQPDDLVILQSGVYNLGFLALAAGPETRALVDWWWSWLATHASIDRLAGTFTDQKWMEFAPVFWPRIEVLRDTTYNVAYWNLLQRRLDRRADGIWLADGRPLAFFHFSGFDPAQPEVLSKHQTRIDVRRGTPLAAMLREYAERVAALGDADFKRLAVPSPTFADGVAADAIARAAFRDATRQGLRFADPLTSGAGSFQAWLSGPVFRDVQDRAAAPITRYLLQLYELRPDVRRVYPDLYGADREGFLHWARERAVEELGVSRELLARQFLRLPPVGEAVGAPRATLAVNLAGYLRVALGIGEAARGYAKALESQGIACRLVDVSTLTSSPVVRDADRPGAAGEPSGPAPINLIHVNADELPNFRHLVGPAFFDGRYNIGLWAWETPRFPERWRDRFGLLDEIWVPSAFVADAIGRVAPVPVLRMPHVVEVPQVAPDRPRFGLAPDEFVFLFSFDYHSTLSRKNPAGAIEAFRRAFRPEEPVRLVVKSLNARSRPRDAARLAVLADGARITLLDAPLGGDERYRLLASCDAFVSLHRAEGFGLGIAEAMAAGKPAIATNWSGNVDFMTADNSFPVRFRLAPLEREDPPYDAGTIWAEPDLDHAAELMRLVVEDRDRVAAVGRRAQADIASSCSATTVGARLRERLELIVAACQPSRATAPISLPAVYTRPSRSAMFRVLRAGWKVALGVAPNRHHPRLHRWTAKLRQRLGARPAF